MLGPKPGMCGEVMMRHPSGRYLVGPIAAPAFANFVEPLLALLHITMPPRQRTDAAAGSEVAATLTLTSLPDELLIRILGHLSTEDT